VKAWVAQRFEISDRTLRRYLKRRDANRLEPDKTGPQDPIKLTGEDDRVMRESVAARPGSPPTSSGRC
jgi:transposase